MFSLAHFPYSVFIMARKVVNITWMVGICCLRYWGCYSGQSNRFLVANYTIKKAVQASHLQYL